MNPLAEAIKDYRSRLGLSARELSIAMDKKEQFIAGLERTGQTTFSTLREIIDYFTKHENFQDDEERSEIGIRLVQAALKMDIGVLPVTDREHDKKVQSELRKGEEVWIISDVVAEDEHLDWLKLSASNITRGVLYSYFFPFSRMEEDCLALAHRLEAISTAPKGDRSTIFKNNLRIYQMTNLAFPIRYRIINPLVHEGQSGVYSLQMTLSHSKKLPIPRIQLGKMIRLLTNMLNDLKLGVASNEKNGKLKQIYP